MVIETKICGLNSAPAIEAAVNGGARYLGLMFYPPSPRYISPEDAAALFADVSGDVKKVGVFVDPDDATLDRVLSTTPLDMLQCHGQEGPDRLDEIKRLSGLPVVKAIKVASAEDTDRAEAFQESADWLLFDAKVPEDLPDALPGGNGLAFDWQLIAGRDWRLPWMLSGGLEAEVLAEAVKTSGAVVIDVSSGVEDKPGVKSPERIKAFLEAARRL